MNSDITPPVRPAGNTGEISGLVPIGPATDRRRRRDGQPPTPKRRPPADPPTPLREEPDPAATRGDDDEGDGSHIDICT